jgi:methylenetetrahydrofolate dehydrogenase (NADP+)/methenyltetrahydrofolate cyclohydrolase
MEGRTILLPPATSREDLLTQLVALNADDATDGILLQLPLPAHLDSDEMLAAIDPAKDVDGFHPLSQGHLLSGKSTFVPCTPRGMMRMLDETGVDLAGQRAVVVGRSTIVGKPMALLLLARNATVTICHSRTKDLPAEVKAADIVVAAIGRPELIKGEWIKQGAIVLDVGINRMADGKLKGDVEFEAARQRASWITPVPGGVGPLTVACLLENTLQAAYQRRRKAR